MTDLEQLQDDIFEGGIASPEDYKEPIGFRPEAAGKYLVKINKIAIDKDADGNIRNPKTPTIVLEELEILQGDRTGKKITFIRVRSNAYERGGVKVSELGDLLRALDRSFDMQGSITKAVEFLQKCVDTGEPMKIRIDWDAFDSDHWKNEGGSELSKEQQKELARACRLAGMKNFPPDGNGGYIPEWVGPSGATVAAKAVVRQFYNSDQKYK